MADTVRDVTALLALLADNSSGDISAQDMRDLLVSLFGVYGGIKVFNNLTGQSITGTTPVLCTQLTTACPTGGGMTADPATAKLTVPAGGDGDYRVFGYAVMSGTTYTGDLVVYPYKNGLITDINPFAYQGDSGQSVNLAWDAIVASVAGDEWTMMIAKDGGGADTILVQHAYFCMQRIG